jgi:hypothetical protein
MGKYNLEKVFITFFSALTLSLSLLAILPGSTLAVEKTPEQRCADLKKQFEAKVGGTTVNIVEQQDLPSYCSASELIVKVINYALLVAGTVTVLFLVVGGFWYLTSAGNEEQAEKGKKTLINSIIGLVVITLSYTIVRIISGTINVIK